jgi:hypothetical protein
MAEIRGKRSADRADDDRAIGLPTPPAERSLWAKAALLESSPRTDAPSGSPEPTEAPVHGIPREASDGRLRYDSHERRSIEILRRERPLVDRVAGVIDGYLDRISPQAWSAASRDARGAIIHQLGQDLAHAMRLRQVSILPVDLDLCGLHYVDEGGHHHIEVARDMDLESTVSTVAHEMRHALQVEMLNERTTGHPDAASWAGNLVEYTDYDDRDPDAYYNQPVEADAFGFERAVGRILRLDWPDI